MYEKPCACGASKKSFKIDIGPFFVNDCCTAAGYDDLGNKLEAKDIGLTDEIVQSVVESTPNLKVEDDSSLDAEEAEVTEETAEPAAEEPKAEVKQETKAEKKARRYNRGGNIKT